MTSHRSNLLNQFSTKTSVISEFEADLLSEKMLMQQLVKKMDTRREIISEKLEVHRQLELRVQKLKKHPQFINGEFKIILSEDC